MDRRDALRTLIVISAGTTLLLSCEDKASMTLTNIPLTGSEEDMLAAIADTLIPKTNNFIGAQDLKSHEFALVMVDDCTSPEDQKLFIDGMSKFDDACKQKMNASFVKCSPEKRKEFLQQLEAGEVVSDNKETNDNIHRFYKMLRHYTLQSFTTSEDYLTKIRNFSLVPEPFQGCVPVTA